MVKTRAAAVLALVTVTMFVPGAAPSYAHHSMSMYDREQSFTLKGTVTNFDWSNPHARIFFDVTGRDGYLENWIGECPGPNRLARAGWVKDSIKSNDQVTIIGNRAKDGSNMMRIGKVVFADGQELTGYPR